MSENDLSGLKGLDDISLDLGAFGSGGGSNQASVKLQALEAFINIAVTECTFTSLITDILLVIMNAVQSEAASVLEIDQQKQALFFRCSVGRASDLLNDIVIPLGKGIAGKVVETCMPVIINNAEENKTHLKTIGDAVGFETQNMVALPLMIRGRVFGVLELLNRIGQPDYSTSDLDTLNYLCQMASKVIELRMMISWKI